MSWEGGEKRGRPANTLCLHHLHEHTRPTHTRPKIKDIEHPPTAPPETPASAFFFSAALSLCRPEDGHPIGIKERRRALPYLSRPPPPQSAPRPPDSNHRSDRFFDRPIGTALVSSLWPQPRSSLWLLLSTRKKKKETRKTFPREENGNRDTLPARPGTRGWPPGATAAIATRRHAPT